MVSQELVYPLQSSSGNASFSSMDFPTEHECKLKFAYYLYKAKGNAFEAMKMFRAKFASWVDDKFEIQYGKLWPFDDIVEEEVARLQAQIPSKETFVNYVWETIDDARKAGDFRAVASLGKVFGDTTGYIAKVTNSAKDQGTDDTFDDMSVPGVETEPVAIAEGVEDGELQPEVG